MGVEGALWEPTAGMQGEGWEGWRQGSWGQEGAVTRKKQEQPVPTGSKRGPAVEGGAQVSGRWLGGCGERCQNRVNRRASSSPLSERLNALCFTDSSLPSMVVFAAKKGKLPSAKPCHALEDALALQSH